MSNTARKARKRAGIPFSKPQKAKSFSPDEWEMLERFGMDKPDGKLMLDHMAFGFAIVIVAVIVVLVGIGLGAWVVLS